MPPRKRKLKQEKEIGRVRYTESGGVSVLVYRDEVMVMGKFGLYVFYPPSEVESRKKSKRGGTGRVDEELLLRLRECDGEMETEERLTCLWRGGDKSSASPKR